MKLFLAATILFAAILAVQSAPKSDYESFKSKFGKKYDDATEDAKRSQIFQKTHKTINDHNARFASGLETYSKGHNDFSDWTDEEKKTILGFKSSASRSLPVPVDNSLLDRVVPPDSYDLRNSSCMPAVKYQGQCGNCYVFASITPIEYQFCIKNNNNTSVKLSEQQGTDCTYPPTRNGCRGGTHEDVFKSIASAGGIATSAAYPYTSGNTKTSGACQSNVTKLAKVSSTYTPILNKNETAVQSALYAYGPITFAYFVTDNFTQYRSGVFSETPCNTSINALNHVMVLVGYGTSSDNIPYWVVRNSWGVSWGQAGYALVKRGVNMCGIATHIGYPTVI